MSSTTESNLIERNATDVCRTVLADKSGDVFAAGLSAGVIEGVLTVLAEQDDPPTIHVLAAESVLKDLVGDFTVASTTADFVADGVLLLRTTETRLDGPLLLTGDRVVSIVSTETYTAGLATDDAEFVETARGQYADHWDDAETFKLRTPPLSRVQESMTEEFGSSVVDDFDRMRVALGASRGRDALDVVDICLLAAARNEVLLYDISTWGEDVGVASRATFSRKKTRLEQRGLIDTEKVPIDVGRPRLRLLFGDERLREADAEDIVSVAASILSTAGS